MCLGLGARGANVSRQVITRRELEKHSTVKDSWVAIKGRVYDVSGFGKLHPGGDIVYTASGTDATGVFNAFHPPSAWTMLQDFYVGDLEETNDVKIKEYEADVLKMRTDLQKLKAFESSKLYYAYKLLSNVVIALLGAFITLSFPTNVFGLAIGGLLIALFFQQCGWLAHDFLHHQVFKNRAYNNSMGILVGNIFQGFSLSWWKNKHNHHHAVPNVTETCAGGDPDIHTMPLLLWSEKLIEGEDLEKLPRFLVRNQSLFYFPILGLARVSWLIQSFIYMLEPTEVFIGGNILRTGEIVGLFIHHALIFWLTSKIPNWPLAVLYFMWIQALGGLLIGIVFTVGHNAMEVMDEQQMKEVDFVQLQLRTTRNVTPSWFNDFFTGGLNYQVEHHIWPTLPRHSLPQASKILQEFCLKHGIDYHCKGLIEGNAEVCALISRLSNGVQ